jgi:hypothetical protein
LIGDVGIAGAVDHDLGRVCGLDLFSTITLSRRAVAHHGYGKLESRISMPASAIMAVTTDLNSHTGTRNFVSRCRRALSGRSAACMGRSTSSGNATHEPLALRIEPAGACRQLRRDVPPKNRRADE